MDIHETAVARFRQGFSCSQAVFSALADQMGIETETALKIAGGFGGGMGRMGLTCGAVTGAIMALGLKYGSTNPTDTQAKDHTYAQVQEFARRFSERHGSITCNTLINSDISTPEGRKQAREAGTFATLCPMLVGDAVKIFEEMQVG